MYIHTYPALAHSLSLSRVVQNFRLWVPGDYNIKKTPRVQLLVCSFYMLRRAFALDVPPPARCACGCTPPISSYSSLNHSPRPQEPMHGR